MLQKNRAIQRVFAILICARSLEYANKGSDWKSQPGAEAREAVLVFSARMSKKLTELAFLGCGGYNMKVSFTGRESQNIKLKKLLKSSVRREEFFYLLKTSQFLLQSATGNDWFFDFQNYQTKVEGTAGLKQPK